MAIIGQEAPGKNPVPAGPPKTTYYPRCFAVLKAVFDGFGAGESDPLIIDVRPKSASVHMNGYRQADTFDCTFDAKNFPFRPELIRNAAIEIYMYQVDSLAVGDEQFNRSENDIMIEGLIDDAELTLTDTGPVYHVSGRDYTALMLDKAWQPSNSTAPSGQNGKVPTGGSLVDTVQQLVDECTHTTRSKEEKHKKPNPKDPNRDIKHEFGLKVVYYGPEYDISTQTVDKTTTQKTVTTKTKPPPKTGTGHSRTAKKGLPVRSGKNYWDVIYSTCLQHGFICYVKGQEVIITTPQVANIIAADDSARLVYGRNLKELHVNRHMGREQVPQIVITSHDYSGKTIEVKYPENPSATVSGAAKPKGQAAKTITGVATEKETIRRIAFDRVKDKTALREIAKLYFESLGRSEAKIQAMTKSLKDTENRDLLRIRPGCPLRLEFDPTLQDLAQFNNSPEQLYGRLKQLGYTDSVAQAAADGFLKIAMLQGPYYTRDVSFEFDNDSGIQVTFEAINYVSVERDAKPEK